MNTLLDPRNSSPKVFLAAASAIGMTERQARRWMGAVLGSGEYEPEAWMSAGIFKRKGTFNLNPLPRLTLDQSVTSTVDGFQKLLFRAGDGLAIETVVIPLHKPGTATVCLSSQVGCVMGCTFCATGRMPQRRNLETWEILDQYIQARAAARDRGLKVTGAVFMGMGEPFLNYERVLAAAELLCFPVKNAISSKSITISTVGLVQEIEKFTAEKRPFRLSISIGAATDEKRRMLVPVAARTPVREVIAAAKRHAADRNDRVMLAYVCISGVNVGVEDAQALSEIVGDTPVRLDLIDVNDSTGRYAPPTSEELNRFRDALTLYLKQPVARRYSGGADIRAACGTLAGVA